MLHLIVTADKLNKRKSIPSFLPDPNNIIGTVYKGYNFLGTEISNVPNPSLGKWYQDNDGYYYWGPALQVVQDADYLSILPENLPPNYRLGIDLSHYNPNPDWNAIKQAGVSFAFIKISDGYGTPDQMAVQHAANAKNNGLKTGYYHFCHPDNKSGGTIDSDATAEAQYALNRIKELPKPDMPLVLDLENANMPLNKNDFFFWIKAFITHIENSGTGLSVIIYSYGPYLNSKLPPDHSLGKYPLWLAKYGPKDCNNVVAPTGWNTWAIWQFTDSAILGKNKFDLNILKDQTLIQ